MAKAPKDATRGKSKALRAALDAVERMGRGAGARSVQAVPPTRGRVLRLDEARARRAARAAKTADA